MKSCKELLQIPKDLALKQFLFTLLVLFVSSMKNITAFFMQNGKNAISDGRILLGLLFIMLYYIKEPIFKLLDLSITKNKEMNKRLIRQKAGERGFEIFLEVGGNLSHMNPKTGYLEKMEASTIKETVEGYLHSAWSKRFWIFDGVANILSSVIMIVGLFKVAIAEIEQLGLFVILIFFTCASYFHYSLGRNNQAKEQSKKEVQSRNNKHKMYQNILNVIPLNDEHASFLQNNYLKAAEESVDVMKEGRQKNKFLDLFLSSSQTIYMIILLLIVLFGKGVDAIDLEMLLTTISIAGIYQNFTRAIEEIVGVVTARIMLNQKIEAEKENFELIMAAYDSKFEKKKNVAIGLCSIEVSPFDVQYDSDNRQKKYELFSQSNISLRRGDFVILTGPTGSGKSTFMNMITFNNDMGADTIRVHAKNQGYPKAVIHRAEQSLGNQPVLDELTLGDSNYDREKLIRLLSAVNLYNELSEKTSDVLYYLAHTDKGKFSCGQNQRLALVRTLFNMEDDVEIIALDEATNNLNDKIALEIIQYIKDFCKHKIVLFATHQVTLLEQVANKHLKFTLTDVEKRYCVTQVQ